MPGALEGVRVIDMTSVGFGPYAAQLLGDYGAEVIKVESPAGDITRGIAPYRNPGMGHFFLSANRNKRSVVLDLKQAPAREALEALVKTADILMSSVRPAAMARLGLDPDQLAALNPKLINVALVGFDQDGPYAARPAYDDIIQGMSGLAASQAGTEGPPRMVNSSVCDKICSQFAVHATMAALFHRERTGEAQRVEVPMLEVMSAFNLVEHHSGQVFEPPLGEAGYARTMAPHRRPFATADGFACVLPYNTGQWQAFFRLMDKPEMVEDPRVTDAKLRSESVGELYATVAQCVSTWPTEKLLSALREADVPSGPVTALGDLATDPQLEAVGLFERHEHPTEGTVRMVRPGVKLSATPVSVRELPPVLGQHSREVLEEAGVDGDTIASLVASGGTVLAK
jgi:crotonobetainyl-CoA:carnitine CoA-transferase CaiB-like acyl-CoA transferase